MEHDLFHIVILVIAGVMSATINVIAGGGSYLGLAVLIFVGLPPSIANATNRVGVLAGNVVGSLQFYREQKLKLSDITYFCLPAMVGGIIGAWAATLIDDRSLRILLAFLMLLGSWMVVKKSPTADETSPEPANSKLSLPLFFGVGLYTGFIQAGAGFFALAASGILGYDLKRGNAIKTLMNLFITVPALLLFAHGSLIDWSVGFALAIGMGIGGAIGVQISQRSQPKKLRKLVAAAIVFSALVLLYPFVAPWIVHLTAS